LADKAAGLGRLVTGDVRLTPVDEQTLEPLLSVAVVETEPDEVMPPVRAPAGWSQARREAFREFYRSSHGGLDGPTRTLNRRAATPIPWPRDRNVARAVSTAALGMLRRCGAVLRDDGTGVRAEIALGPD
jgi:hypothetical protein